VGFEPTIPVFKRVKTFYALDRSATVIGKLKLQMMRFCYVIFFIPQLFTALYVWCSPEWFIYKLCTIGCQGSFQDNGVMCTAGLRAIKCFRRECQSFQWILRSFSGHVDFVYFLCPFLFKEIFSYHINWDCAIAQAVSRRVAMAAARVRSQVRSCRICGGQSGSGAGFLRVLRFPLPILIPPTAPHPSSISRS
jgi:hypothetical protein